MTLTGSPVSDMTPITLGPGSCFPCHASSYIFRLQASSLRPRFRVGSASNPSRTQHMPGPPPPCILRSYHTLTSSHKRDCFDDVEVEYS